jgi:hypothetical protein
MSNRARWLLAYIVLRVAPLLFGPFLGDAPTAVRARIAAGKL